MSSRVPYPIFEGRTVDWRDTELLPETASPSMQTIFALSSLAITEQAGAELYPPDAYRANIPPLDAPHRASGPAFDLTPEAREAVARRAERIVTGPFRHGGVYPVTTNGMRYAQAWADGLARGMTQKEMIRDLDGTRVTIAAGKLLQDYLGTFNPISTMYSLLLHGYRPEAAEEPAGFGLVLNPRERLHFWLSLIGYSAAEAEQLVGPSGPDRTPAVGNMRYRVSSRYFGVTRGTHAVVRAFDCNYLERLPQPAVEQE